MVDRTLQIQPVRSGTSGVARNHEQRHACSVQGHQCLDTAQLQPRREPHWAPPHLRYRGDAVRERAERKVDRIKKKFVLEGLELTLNCQPSQC